MPRKLTEDQFAKLLEFRTALRRFGRWSEDQAAKMGLTAAQYQLLIAIRGHGDPRGPTIGDVADHLLTRHHSAVGLIDRTEQLGLVERQRDRANHRIVRLRLTPLGHRRVNTLAAAHLSELHQLTAALNVLLETSPSPAR